MRIDSSDLIESSALQSGKATDTQAIDDAVDSRTSAKVATGASDAVEVSQFVSRLSSTLDADSTERSGMIEALSASYESGSYQIDSVAVSRAMVSEIQISAQLSMLSSGTSSA